MNGDIKIMFMRHGRSRADDENVIEGRYDAPLTDVGREQAEARAQELKAREIKFDRIIASPLKRACETAQIAGNILGVSVEFDEDWMEKDNGPIAGLPHQVARAKYPLPAFHNPFQPHVVSADAGRECVGTSLSGRTGTGESDQTGKRALSGSRTRRYFKCHVAMHSWCTAPSQWSGD